MFPLPFFGCCISWAERSTKLKNHISYPQGNMKQQEKGQLGTWGREENQNLEAAESQGLVEQVQRSLTSKGLL